MDFIEVAVDAGTDVSDIFVTVYNPNGTIRTVNALGSLVATEHGKDIYVLDTATSSTFNGLHANGAVALEQGGVLIQLVEFTNGTNVTPSEGIAAGETPDVIGSAGNGESLETTDGGVSYSTQTNPTSGSVPCLCAGSMVATNKGQIAVEDLQAGDQIQTLDGEFATLRKIYSRHVCTYDMRKNPKLRPIKITAGSLGQELPKRDLWMSRQHRMLASSRITRRMTSDHHALISAVHLTILPGIFVDCDITEVTYYHLLFDAHEVILAEGAPTESLLVGKEALSTLDPDTRAEIEFCFAGSNRSPCASIPKREQQKNLVMRHLKNSKPLLGAFIA